MKVELLAPAGSYAAMEAAIRAGADAVYLGGQKFGARAYADNLDQKQMIDAIEMVHLHEKQLYVTVNTLLKNKEMEQELYDYLAPFYEAGLDAVIVQDLGVMEFIKREFPKLPIHASTQMTITGVESARLLKEAGASRIVTARELSLQEIKEIYDQTHMEIESFVHGALCYCYSGQCLMSSMIGGRSGNRGRCAQPCRLPYQVYKQGKRQNNEKTAYPLSPKDMCTIRILPEIIEAGVYSLKIEGRMKKPEYTAGVVEIYRKYLDRYLAGEKRPIVSQEDYQILMDLYNRDGFHESYYKVRNGRDMMALRNEKKTVSGADMKNARNEILFSRLKKMYLDEKKPEMIQGMLSLYANCPAILEIHFGHHHIMEMGELVQEASNRPLDEERVRKQMKKTGDTEFAFSQLDICMGDNVFLPMQQLNELRRKALEALKYEILNPHRRKLPEKKKVLDKTVHEKVEKKIITASVRTLEQLDVILKIKEISRVYVECGIFAKKEFKTQILFWMKKAKDAKKEFYLHLPHVVRDQELQGRSECFQELVEAGLDGFLVRNLESYGILRKIGLKEKVVLDYNVYTMNTESQRFWNRQGIAGDTIPLEMNGKEIRHRDNTKSELCVYGYAPMMVSVQCIQKNLNSCDGKCAVFTLKDRYQKEFHAVCNCEFCYNTIYNTLPMSLLKESENLEKSGISKYRLSFTLENAKETQEIAKGFVDAFLYGKQPNKKLLQMETTKGHFQRGVE